MSVPDFLQTPDAPQPDSRGIWFPHVIAQHPNDDGSVTVTWALPGPTVAHVRVPQAVWLQAQHYPIGDSLAQLLLLLDRSARGSDVEAPQDSIDSTG